MDWIYWQFSNDSRPGVDDAIVEYEGQRTIGSELKYIKRHEVRKSAGIYDISVAMLSTMRHVVEKITEIATKIYNSGKYRSIQLNHSSYQCPKLAEHLILKCTINLCNEPCSFVEAVWKKGSHNTKKSREVSDRDACCPLLLFSLYVDRRNTLSAAKYS